MASSAAPRDIREYLFEWEGKDRNGKQIRGETRAAGENQVKSALRRQGVTPTRIKKRRMSRSDINKLLTVEYKTCRSLAKRCSTVRR